MMKVSAIIDMLFFLTLYGAGLTLTAAEIQVDLGSGVTFAMIRVEPGTFMIGSPAIENAHRDNENPHLIRISKPYYLGQCEVTQAVWERVMSAKITNPLAKTNSFGLFWPHSDPMDVTGNPRPAKFPGPERPVDSVSWRQCQEFIARLNLLVADGGFRLPTEAEWEYAARAGTATAYFFGSDMSALGDYVWYKTNSGGETHRVGTKQATPWGFFDLYGNVWEWCEDQFTGPYPFPGTEPLVDYCNRGNAYGNAQQVIRGGSYAFSGRLCRSASRSGFDAWQWIDDVGFRLARTVGSRDVTDQQ